MKKYLLLLLLLAPLMAPAQYAPPTGNEQAVTVDKSTGMLIKPPNFATANGLATTNSAPANVVGLRKSNGPATTDTAAISTDLQSIIGIHIYQPWSSTLATLAAGNPITAGSNVTVAGTWPNITINAANQVLADWNASSGIGVILNKPTIPTVPAYGTTAGTIAQGNDSRITGALQSNTANTAGGAVTVNSNGYASPNISHSSPNFLLLGSQGAFLSGYERLVLMHSGNGISFSQILGWENYVPTAPPDSGSYTCGVRDPALVHFPNGTYLVAHTVSRSNGSSSNYVNIAKASSLSSPLAHVTSVSTGGGIAPKFLYTASGQLFMYTYNQITENTSRTGGYPDGVSWSAVSTITFSDLTSPNNSDQAAIQSGSTYGLFYWRTGATFIYRLATSNSPGSGYTDQGVIPNWPVAEGVSVSQDVLTGIWYAYFQARSGTYSGNTVVSTSATPLVAASWSLPVPLTSLATGFPSSLATGFDNSGIMISHDASVALDVMNATQQTAYWHWSGPDFPPRLIAKNPVCFTTANQAAYFPQGEGTVGISGSVATGVGTRFTRHFQVGSLILAGGRLSSVRSVTSDTSMALFANGGFTVATGSTYNFYSPPWQTVTYAGNAVTQFVDAYQGFFWSAGTIFFNPNTSSQPWAIIVDSSGNWNLLSTPFGGGSSTTVMSISATNANSVTLNTGHLIIGTAGKGIQVKEGSNAKQGTATLVAGTVAVSNTNVTATSRIFLSAQSLGTVTTPKALAVTARTAGTSFTITSADATDTSVVAYEIFEPAP